MNLSTAISFLPIQSVDGQRAVSPLVAAGASVVSLAQLPAASVTPSTSSGNNSSNNSSGNDDGEKSRNALVDEARFKVQAIAGLSAVDEVVSSDGSIDFVKLNYILDQDHQASNPAPAVESPVQTADPLKHLDLQA